MTWRASESLIKFQNDLVEMAFSKKYLIVPGDLVSFKLAVLIGLMIVMSCCSTSVWAQDISYSWFASNTGGGGYITGIVQDRNNQDG